MGHLVAVDDKIKFQLNREEVGTFIFFIFFLFSLFLFLTTSPTLPPRFQAAFVAATNPGERDDSRTTIPVNERGLRRPDERTGVRADYNRSGSRDCVI